MPKPLRNRRVHLDFHTSEHLPDVGSRFDADRWKSDLQRSHVGAITLFAKCQHGYSYHPTEAGAMHPNLGFDLLRAQVQVCRDIDVEVNLYIAAGMDSYALEQHPEWHEIDEDGSYLGWSVPLFEPSYRIPCFRTPYLDYLTAQVKEVVRLFPEAEGLFLDIIQQSGCCCRWCRAFMADQGLDAADEAERRRAADLTLEHYYTQINQAIHRLDPEMRVFHNTGHVYRGRRDIVAHNTHLELESLPTGGWDYDHFAVSARYCGHLGRDVLGMTARYHTTWGEFGGHKHPAALWYEAARMLALGTHVAIGDQLHPEGVFDATSLDVIAPAFEHVEACEPWCHGATPVAEIAVLSSAAVRRTRDFKDDAFDVGAARVLGEGHFLFTVIDEQADLSAYKLVIVPDDVRLDDDTLAKLRSFHETGGRLLLCGEGLLTRDGTPVLDFGAEVLGPSPFEPHYILPNESLRPSFVRTPMVMYLPALRIKARGGESLGQVFDPHFNRTWRHFTSLQHAPPKPEPSDADSGVRLDRITALPQRVFSAYRAVGNVALRDYLVRVIDTALGDQRTVRTNLPSPAEVTLMHQPAAGRHVLHLLYAAKAMRGGRMKMVGGTVSEMVEAVEVIESLPPLRDVSLAVRLPVAPKSVTLEPGGEPLDCAWDGQRVQATVATFSGHQMVVFHRA